MPNPNGTKLSLNVVHLSGGSLYAATIVALNPDSVDLRVLSKTSPAEDINVGNVQYSASPAEGCWSFAQ